MTQERLCECLTFARAQGDLRSHTITSSERTLSATSRSTTTASVYFDSAWTTDTCLSPPSLAISEHSPLSGPGAIAVWLTSWRRASHVSPSQPLGLREAQTTPATCGLSSLTVCAVWDRSASTWRTSEGSLLDLMGATSQTRSSVALPPSGIAWDGLCYPLPTWVPITSESDCGSQQGATARTSVGGRWPTPTTDTRPCEGNVRLLRARVLSGALSELDAVSILGKSPLAAQGKIPAHRWPTPTVNGNHNRRGLSARSGDGLATAARQWKGSSTRDPRRGSPDFDAERAVTKSTTLTHERTQGHGLSPAFVEWLMGWPDGWTDLCALDILSWPDWSQDHPSPTAPKADRHSARIKALGNGQVPQCAATAWSWLDKHLEGLS